MSVKYSHGYESIYQHNFLQSSQSDSTREQVHLPQELIDIILDILGAQENHKALAQCLLVSRSFFVRARRNLFAKISTREYSFPSPGRREMEKMEDLLQILQEDQLRFVDPLALHVRSLRVSMFPASEMYTASPTIRPMDWNARQECLSRVLNMLSKLHIFGLGFTTPMSWKLIQSPMRDSLAKLFGSSLLTTLYLSNIHHFPTEILGQCVNLRDLRLQHIYLRTPTSPLVYSRQQVVANWDTKSFQHLENVECESASGIFAEIMVAKANKSLVAPFARLKSVTLHLSHAGLAKEWEMMKCAASSLERLTVHGLDSSQPSPASPAYSMFPGPIRLSDLTSLRTLVLRVNVSLYQLPLSPMGLAYVLIHISGPTTIESVIVNFETLTTLTRETERRFFSRDNSSAWPAIDTALTGGSFPSLGKVLFTFRWQYRGSQLPLHDGRDDPGKNGRPPTDDTQHSVDKHRKENGKRDEALVSLRVQAEAALPKLSHSQRIEYKTEFDVRL